MAAGLLCPTKTGYGKEQRMKTSTKTTKFVGMLALGIGLGSLQPPTIRADVLYQLTWSGTALTANTQGQVVSYPFNQQLFVNKVAQDNKLDPSTLVFVYRPLKRDTVVVKAATGEFVADVIQLEFDYTDVGNSGSKMIAKQAFLDDEYHSGHIGSIVGGERAARDAKGNFTSYLFSGLFQMTMPEKSTVYYGSFRTGARVVDKTNAP